MQLNEGHLGAARPPPPGCRKCIVATNIAEVPGAGHNLTLKNCWLTVWPWMFLDVLGILFVTWLTPFEHLVLYWSVVNFFVDDHSPNRHLWPLMAFSSWLIQGWQRWWPEVTTLRLHLCWKESVEGSVAAKVKMYNSKTGLQQLPIRRVAAICFSRIFSPDQGCQCKLIFPVLRPDSHPVRFAGMDSLLITPVSQAGNAPERKCEYPYMQGSNIWTAPTRLPGCFKKPDGKHRAPWSKTSLSRACNKGRWP